METGFSFRKLLPDDVPVIFDLHQQWFPIRIEDEFYRLLLSDTYYCIVATHSGNRAEQEIVGFLSAQSDWSTDDIPVANRRDSMMYISSMGVTESARHKGLGSMLLHQLLEHCRKEKFAAIFLHVIVTNGGAIRFYEKHNFKRICRLANFYTTGDGGIGDAFLYLLDVDVS